MAGKRDPSIYNERTSIGSSDDLDEYGVWVKTGPQDLSSSMPDIEELPDFDSDFTDTVPELENIAMDDLDMPDFSDTEADSGDTALPSDDIEFEEIPEGLELPEGQAISEIDSDGFTEVSMDDFLDISDLDSPESIDFGNLDSSVSEIETFDKDNDLAVPPSTGEHHSFSDDRSTKLLQKIADELSSIKKEISGLKTELSVVRGEVKAQENAEAAGFFDEEDDEKIALTGDELDNILNTANFTEETGAGEGIDINFDEDVSELDGAVSINEDTSIPGIDDFEIALDLTPDFQEGSGELDMLREEGALPLTEAPEDTSYLDDEIDLSDTVIDEPDLSEGITENPVSPPVIDNISIDLDMEEAVPETLGQDNFIFEPEETMELPSFETIDDKPVEDLLPAISDDLSFSEVDINDFDAPKADKTAGLDEEIPNNLKQELKTVLSYMDQLLESLPEDKIEEFAKSEYFETYKKLFEELGLV